MFGRVAFCTLVVLLLFSFAQLGFSQGEATAGLDGGPQGTVGNAPYYYSLFRSFCDSEGELLVRGQFQKMEGNTVQIAEEGGGIEKFHLDRFCPEDVKYIRRKVAEQKKIESKRGDASRLATTLFQDNERNMLRSLNRLRTYGLAASHLLPNIDPLLKHDNPKVRVAAFVCYAGIAPLSPVSVDRIEKELTKDDSKITPELQKRPRAFLLEMSRYKDYGLPYLRSVAFTGQIDVVGKDVNEIDVATWGKGSPRSAIRKDAMEAVAKTGLGEEAARLLLEIYEAELDNDDADPKTIGKLIDALGNLRFVNDEIVELLDANEKEYAKNVASAKKKLKLDK